MKTFKIPWRPLLITAGLLNGLGAAAQYVQVPAGCNVVDAGTGVGGQTGPGGLVTDGGTITMSDVFDPGGAFTFSAGTPLYWQIWGDLSLSSTGFLRSVFNVNPATIRSYNFEPHTWEGPTAATRPGRSKGRIVVKYSDGPCDKWMSFDVYKTFPATYLPPIVGPQCIVLGASATYSVAPIVSDNLTQAIGTDLYYWKLTNVDGADLLIPESNLSYLAPDHSSITIQWTGTAFTNWYNNGNKGPYRLCCYYGRANAIWDQRGTDLDPGPPPQANGVCLDLNAAPVNPLGNFMCAPIDQNSVTYPYTPKPGFTYTWSTSTPGWQVSSATGSVTISGILGTGTGTLRATVRDACNNVMDFNIPIMRQIAPISVSATSCQAPGSTFTVTIPEGLAQTDLCIMASRYGDATYPPQSWPAQQNGRVLTFTVPDGICAGTYLLNLGYANIGFSTGCRCGTTVVINVSPMTPVISGPTCVIPNVSAVYNAGGTCGANSFIWSNSLGMTSGGSQTTTPPQIVYTPSTGTGTGVVSVTARYSIDQLHYCDGPPATMNVSRTTVAPVLDALPCVNVNVSGTATYSVANPQSGSVYTWSFPGQFGSPTAPTGTSVTMNTNGVPGSYTCSVTASVPGSNCTPVTTEFTVNIDASVYLIDTTETPTSTTIFVTQVDNTVYQLWDCTNNVAVTPYTFGGYTEGLTDTFSGSYAFNCIPGNAGGCVQRTPCITTNNSYRSATQEPAGGQQHTGQLRDGNAASGAVVGEVRISPNPNDGTFTLNILRDVQEGTVTLTDGKGGQVGTRGRVVKGANVLHYDHLTPGVYLVRVDLDGQVHTQNIVITAK